MKGELVVLVAIVTFVAGRRRIGFFSSFVFLWDSSCRIFFGRFCPSINYYYLRRTFQQRLSNRYFLLFSLFSPLLSLIFLFVKGEENEMWARGCVRSIAENAARIQSAHQSERGRRDHKSGFAMPRVARVPGRGNRAEKREGMDV